jgi:hypothetical protein
MKFVARFLSLTLLAGAALFYASCGGDDGDTKSDEEIQLDALNKSWTLSSATFDDTDIRTADFNGMILTLSGTFSPGATYSYSITGTTPTPSPWPRTGTWKFGADVKTQMIRTSNSENLPMTYTLSGNTLTIEFNCEACEFAGGGRVSSVNGDWKFVFTSN